MSRRAASALERSGSEGSGSDGEESLGGGQPPRALSTVTVARQRAVLAQSHRQQFTAALAEHFAAYDDSTPQGSARAAGAYQRCPRWVHASA